MKKFTLSLLLFALSFFAYGQTTVTKSYLGPTVTVDGCGTFCVPVGGVTFNTTDFPNGCEITDVNISIDWLKTDGACDAPGTGNSYHAETSFRLDSPTTQVILANSGTWSGADDIAPVTTVFDQAAGGIPSGVPVDGTFLPNGGNLDSFNATDVLGTWVLSAGDNAGSDPLCVISYSITVTVADDTTPPTITCPANVTANNDAGVCGAVVNYTTPIGTDNCSGATTVQTAGLASGSTFPVGTTTNTFEVTDGAGLISSCSFNVTVNDTEAPTITCPANVAVNNDAGDCGAVVNYTTPVGADNCSTSLITFSEAFITGQSSTHCNTWNNFRAQLISGLNYSRVTIKGSNDPVGVSVTDPVKVQQLADGLRTGTTVNISDGGINWVTGNCGFIDFSGGTPAIALSATGNTCGCENPGYVVRPCIDVYTVNSNWGGAGTAVCGGPSQTLTVEFEIAGSITTQTAGLPSGSTFPVGTTTNTFVVTDGAGNTNTCSFDVTVTDNEAPTFTCVGSGSGNLEATTLSDPTADGIFNAADTTTSPLTATPSANGTLGWFNSGGLNCFGNAAADYSGNPTFDGLFNVDASGIFSTPTTFNNGDFIDVSTGTTGWGIISNLAPGTYNLGVRTISDHYGYMNISYDGTDIIINNLVINSVVGQGITVGSTPGVPAAFTTSGDGNLGDCAYTVNGTELDPTNPMDNCGVASIINDFNSSNTLAGANIPVGNTAIQWTITDVNGNTSNCTTGVVVTDDEAPTIACPANITVSNDLGVCGAAVTYSVTSSDNCPGETVIQTAGLASGSVFPVGTTTNTFEVTDAAGLTATCSFDVTVNDTEAPTIACPANITVSNDLGVCGAAVTYSVTSSDNCPGETVVQTAGLASGSVFPVGTTTNTFEVTDTAGLTATCSFDVTVNDTEAPMFTCQDTTVELDANGMVSITPEDVLVNISPAVLNMVSSSGDNQSNAQGLTDFTATVLTTQTLSFDWSYTTPDGAQFDTFGYLLNGTYTQLTDNAGANNQTGSATINVSAGDIFGFRSLTVDNIVGPATTTVSNFVPGFDGEYDPANWTLVLTNSDGNASFQTVTAGVYATDNCGVASLSVSPNMFDCTHVGPNTVTVTVTDINGNSATCTAVVTVEDNIAPVALCTPFTAQLDAAGNVTITGADVDGGSSDACGIASLDVSPNTFTCAEVGDNTVTLTVTDVNGNSSSCTTTVTVEDNVAPTAVCANIDAVLDANGMVSITPADVDGGSTDACGIASLSIDVTDFSCADLGPNDVVLTVTDTNGNVSTCTAVVTVIDDTPPIIACPMDVVANTDPGMCGAVVIFADAIALDNCDVTVAQTGGLPSGSEFPVGVSTVEYTATDSSGNETVCTFTITVTDNEPAMAVCQDITIQLDAMGVATIVAADVDGGSTDNCGIAGIAIDMDTFDCSNVGDNNVTLEVTDVNGNVSTCIAVVTVEDVTTPDVVCMDITVELDATGSVTITGADVDGGSTDACGIATYQLDIDTFDCSNVGENTVVLTVTDVNGNVSTCTAIVTVEDTTAPELVCMDITVELDENGMAEITADDVIASNVDNCGIMTSAVDITMFDCSDIGTPVMVQVFTQDSNGNLSSCFATVTVVDVMAPVITCPVDQTVDPGAGNLFYVVPDYFATGEATVVDNCTDPVTILSQDPAAGALISDGVYTVTLTAEDEYGNIGECTFELTVESILGIGDNPVDVSTIVMYPNPATQFVTISNPQNIQLDTAAIYDVTGRLVATHNLHDMNSEATLNISELSSATYLVFISGPEGQITKQLIKE